MKGNCNLKYYRQFRHWLLFIILLDLVLFALSVASYAEIAAPPSASPPSKDLEIYFRTSKESFNRLYDFAVQAGVIWFRWHQKSYDVNGEHSIGTVGQWQMLRLPTFLKDKIITEISVDDHNLMALDSEGYIYTASNLLNSKPKKFRWTQKWGAPLWKGPPMKVPPDKIAWAASFYSPKEDLYYEGVDGQHHCVGEGVTNLYFVDKTGRSIVYLDPWLPNDTSYKVPPPINDQTISRIGNIIAMSASGSTIFIMDNLGKMFTRIYDFDISGGDEVFFRYTSEGEDKEYFDSAISKVTWPIRCAGCRSNKRMLPPPDWKECLPIQDGKITGLITIIKYGVGGKNRLLRVEGIDSKNQVGFFEKDINAVEWHFVKTNRSLEGKILEEGKRIEVTTANNPSTAEEGFTEFNSEIMLKKSGKDLGNGADSASSSDPVSDNPDNPYDVDDFGSDSGSDLLSFNIKFHPYITPLTLTLKKSGEKSTDAEIIKLRLHTTHPIRQKAIPDYLTSEDLILIGRIEIPKEYLSNHLTPVWAQKFLNYYFENRRFSKVGIRVNKRQMRITVLKNKKIYNFFTSGIKTGKNN